VDESFKPYRESDIEPDNFYTAFPEGLSEAGREELGAALIVVRLPPSQLRLPPELEGYDAGGIVAYSKICPHAGCAISMYRAPLFQPDEPRPAFVCPCHYSTFNPADGGSVMFGPAGRRLPMLPLSADGKGFLRAKGNFDDEVGPSWWGIRIWKPNP
jgi:ubiquinol-cytochrome c reductase iron-sulfur subunit